MKPYFLERKDPCVVCFFQLHEYPKAEITPAQSNFWKRQRVWRSYQSQIN